MSELRQGVNILFQQLNQMYFLHSNTLKEIQLHTGIIGIELRRFVRRCLEVDDFGQAWGFRALIPRKRIKKYHRNDIALKNNKSENFTGAFSQLLETYPALNDLFNNLLSNKSDFKEPGIIKKFIHKRFLDQCRKEGIKLNEYPFNTMNLARKSVERHIDKILNKKLTSLNNSISCEEFKPKHSSVIRPFQRVQFDGHRIDVLISITFKTPEGDEITSIMERIWLLVIIDVGTDAILGYYISLNKEYSSYDVLKCIKNAVMPWKPKDFTIPGLCYPEKGGYPSGLIPETKWAAWDELYYDNAKANLSNYVKERLTELIGCAVNAGPVNNPQRRGLVESFFRILEDNGFHRLPSTTGSSPKDPRRKKSEKNAVKYNITWEHLEELTEILIANYNCTPNQGNNYLTPLEAMEQRINRGMPLRLIPAEKRNELDFFSIRAQRTVTGSVENGKRPYINYEGVSYKNNILARSPDLIGTKLTLYINTEDLRSIKAFLPDGSELGLLTAAGKWGVVEHSIQIRKAINKLRNRKLLNLSLLDDPVEKYYSYLQKEAKNKRGPRNKIAELDRKKKNSNLFDSSLQNKNNKIIEIDTSSLQYKNNKKVEKIDTEENFNEKCKITKGSKTIVY